MHGNGPSPVPAVSAQATKDQTRAGMTASYHPKAAVAQTRAAAGWRTLSQQRAVLGELGARSRSRVVRARRSRADEGDHALAGAAAGGSIAHDLDLGDGAAKGLGTCRHEGSARIIAIRRVSSLDTGCRYEVAQAIRRQNFRLAWHITR
ncbi:hypothetical protein GCM10018952_52840 [Streptosporangium vulgare]